MAEPSAWKCYACLYVGPTAEFTRESDHICPKCQSEDVFPYRLYRCKKCGQIGDQDFWFEESEADIDPLDPSEEPIPANPCESCVKKLEAEFGNTKHSIYFSYKLEQLEKFDELDEKPAELEEIPVEFPI